MSEKNKARKLRKLWLINGIATTAKSSVIKRLAKQAGIRQDEAITLSSATVPAETPSEWNIQMTGSETLWTLGYQGQGVVVADMGTGADLHRYSPFFGGSGDCTDADGDGCFAETGCDTEQD